MANLIPGIRCFSDSPVTLRNGINVLESTITEAMPTLQEIAEKNNSLLSFLIRAHLHHVSMKLTAPEHALCQRIIDGPHMGGYYTMRSSAGRVLVNAVVYDREAHTYKVVDPKRPLELSGTGS